MKPSWEQARGEILRRLHRVREFIDQKDEDGVLALINQQDEFCEKAARRLALAPIESQSVPPCRYCEGFIQAGGCEGALSRINRSVTRGDWGEARHAVEEYVSLVQGLRLRS
ncbi:MAG: hypothetical protein ACE5HD_08165 [Acidobacteriota bacterium]